MALVEPESVNQGKLKVIFGRLKQTETEGVWPGWALPPALIEADIMRKTALLTSVAGLLLMTAPAFAQDSTATPQTPAPASPPAAEQPHALELQPGSDVKGSDGTVLGKLEGARNTPAGQELTVRGPDGVLRGVPVSGGVHQDGPGVAVGWTGAQFTAAPAITEPAQPETPAEPPAPAEPATPPNN
jgi:hypothetical protein